MWESELRGTEIRDRSTIETVLTASGWLARCSPDLQRHLLALGRISRFESGEDLFRIGDEPEGIYGVAEGAVHIAMPTDDGQELVIYHADTGFWVGDLELFSELPRMATVTAAVPTLCLFLSRSKLRGLLDGGLGSDDAVILRAFEALERDSSDFSREFKKVGSVLDSRGFGGSESIRAALNVILKSSL